jgi:cell division initiation protein
MKLTPLDIKKQEFKKVLRGYDPIEVDAFMDLVSTELTEILRENKDIKEKATEFEIQLRDYKQMEKTLQQTLMQAQEASGRSIENSRKEAQLILQEADLKASQLLDRARMDLMRAKEEISTLRSKKDSIVSRLKVLLNSEIELIKALEIDEDNVSSDPSKGTGKENIEIDEIMKKL